MKKILVAFLVILLLLLGNAGCAKEIPEIMPESSEDTKVEADVQEVEYDYDKILNGDLSEFAGTWKNGNNDTITLKADGTTGADETEIDGVLYKEKADGFEKSRRGWYSWGVALENYDGPSGYGLILYPVGVEVVVEEGEIVQTDTTRVRLFVGQGFDIASRMGNEIYYMD